MFSPLQVRALAPWSRPGGPSPRPLGQRNPPALPEARTTRFSYLAGSGATQNWGRDGWAATPRIPSYPGGGIALNPVPERGVMQVFSWWPDARRLFLIRSHADGSRYPVRGGTPLTVEGRTRRNGIRNPSGEAGPGGQLAGRGAPTISHVARASIAVDGGVYATRVSAAAAGESELVWSIDEVAAPSGSATVSLDLSTDTRLASMAAVVSWRDVVGNPLADTATALSDRQLAAITGAMPRVVLHAQAPADAVAATGVRLYTAGAGAGSRFDVDCAVLEDGITDGSYVAGSMPGGQWVGSPELSASINPPVQLLEDRECPLDQRVRYEVFYTGLASGRMRSGWESLHARRSRYSGWITHPTLPDVVPLWVTRDPELSRSIVRERIEVQGRTNPIVITDGTRRAGSGTFLLQVEGAAERRRLNALLDDGAPLCIRFPAHYDHPDLWWVSIDTVAISNPRGDAPFYRREFSAPFDPVDPPSAIDYGMSVSR